MRFAFITLLLLTISGCRCGRLTQGTCDGTWGGTTVSGASLDASSRMVVVRKKTCEGVDAFSYDLSWGKGAIAATFNLDANAPSVLSAKEYTLPAAEFTTFIIQPTRPEPTGTLTLGLRGMEGDRTGTLHLKNESEELTCTFAVSYETEGTLLFCEPPDGGDGG